MICKKKRILIQRAILTLLLSEGHTALAGTMGAPTLTIPPRALVTTLVVGPAWYTAGQTQTLALDTDVLNTYNPTRNQHALTNVELFVGVQRALRPTWLAQLGLAIATASDAEVQGDVWQLADPDFNNFSDQYSITHAQLTVQGKLLSTYFSQVLQPYISASLGAARNRAHGYSITPKIFQAVPGPGFLTNTQTAFTYTAGAGIQGMITPHWACGAGYTFADWGKSALKPATAQTTNAAPSLNHLYTHQAQVNVSYFIT
jgi:opacity protein-like surface antigen